RSMPSLLSRLSTWTPAFPWVTPRFVGAVVVLALLYAASNFVHVLAVATFVLAVVLAGFLVTDWTIGPRTRDVTVSREPLAHLALRSPAVLRYSIVNRGRTAIRYWLVDSPVDLLQLPETPAHGTVGAGKRVLARINALPVERGDAMLGALYVWAENPVGLI